MQLFFFICIIHIFNLVQVQNLTKSMKPSKKVRMICFISLLPIKYIKPETFEAFLKV